MFFPELSPDRKSDNHETAGDFNGFETGKWTSQNIEKNLALQWVWGMTKVLVRVIDL